MSWFDKLATEALFKSVVKCNFNIGLEDVMNYHRFFKNRTRNDHKIVMNIPFLSQALQTKHQLELTAKLLALAKVAC